MELIEKFSAEGFRYYFMSQCPFGGDGEFSFERFAETYNSGLANNLGNLYSRILTMCLKYFDGRLDGADRDRCDAVAPGARPRRAGRRRCASRSARSSTAPALQRIWRDVVDAANRYIQETEPFKLAKTDLAACRAVLVNLAEWLRVTAILIKPFLPRTAETFYRAFNFEEMQGVGPGRLQRCVAAPLAAGTARDGAAVRRQAGAALSQDRGPPLELSKLHNGSVRPPRRSTRSGAAALKARSPG